MKLNRLKVQNLPTGVLGLAVSQAEPLAYASCMDGKIYRVEVETGHVEAFSQAHTAYASGCVLLPDGKTLISAGYDGQLLWHDTATRRCWRSVQAHRFWSWQLAASPDGTRVASVTGQYIAGGWKYEPAPETEPSVQVFDTHTGDLIASLPHQPPTLSVAFSADNRYLAAANMMGEVRVWDLLNPQQPVCQLKSPDFTSWGTTKTHHYCGGVFGLAFAPNGGSLLACGMGPMGDPMAGNGKMTWQQWNWRTGEKMQQIKDGQGGTGLMESIAWHPAGQHFLMAGRQAQGTWNMALFTTADGNLVHSVDTKSRITHAHFTADGKKVIASITQGQGQPKPDGTWPEYGKLEVYEVVG